MKPAGNPESFPVSVTMPDGSTVRGKPESFPVEITLPDGTRYRGRTPERRAADEAARKGE